MRPQDVAHRWDLRRASAEIGVTDSSGGDGMVRAAGNANRVRRGARLADAAGTIECITHPGSTAARGASTHPIA